MPKILTSWILLLGLILIGECYEDLPGGENMAVIGHGQGSDGSASSPPVYGYPKNAIITRDPSNYVVPVINIPRPNPSDGTSTSSNGNLSSSRDGTIFFAMTSDVEGSGSFAVKSKFEEHDESYKAYQSVSARYGNLTQSRKMSFSEDEQASTDIAYSLGKIDIDESIQFVGISYSDISRFRNKDDLIQENIRAGAISKESRFISQYLQISLDNNETKTLYNNYTIYNIGTRFVGSSDLHSITNGTEVMQTYIGEIALNRKIASQFKANNTFLTDEWLPCCNSSFVSNEF